MAFVVEVEEDEVVVGTEEEPEDDDEVDVGVEKELDGEDEVDLETVEEIAEFVCWPPGPSVEP